MKLRLVLSLSILLGSIAFSTACGGGGGGASSASTLTTATPPAVPHIITITTPGTLPSTVTGHSYSATLAATGGSGTLHWTMAQIANTFFTTGLSIDATTGVVSGTANFQGTGGFTATVTDSSSPPSTATKTFIVTAGGPLTPGADRTLNENLFVQESLPPLGVQGGAIPLSYSVSAGSLPPGLHMDATTGAITGSPYVRGTYTATITTQDSLSPPESVSLHITVNILPAPLIIAASIPNSLPINVPFTGQVFAAGGAFPYSFSVLPGTALPSGLSLDASTGRVTGTPTVAGFDSFILSVTDSSSPALFATVYVTTAVTAPKAVTTRLLPRHVLGWGARSQMPLSVLTSIRPMARHSLQTTTITSLWPRLAPSCM